MDGWRSKVDKQRSSEAFVVLCWVCDVSGVSCVNRGLQFVYPVLEERQEVVALFPA